MDKTDNKKRLIPVILMLLGGLVTILVTFLRSFSLVAELGATLAVMAVMYVVGSAVIKVIEHFEKVNFEKEEAERKAQEEAESMALATDGNVEEKEE